MEYTKDDYKGFIYAYRHMESGFIDYFYIESYNLNNLISYLNNLNIGETNVHHFQKAIEPIITEDLKKEMLKSLVAQFKKDKIKIIFITKYKIGNYKIYKILIC